MEKRILKELPCLVFSVLEFNKQEIDAKREREGEEGAAQPCIDKPRYPYLRNSKQVLHKCFIDSYCKTELS